MLAALLLLLAMLAAGALWHLRSRKVQPPPVIVNGKLPVGLSLRAQPMLTQAEAAFYNVLHLVVQEQYLVFARVPISSLVRVQAKDPHDLRLAAFLSRRLARRCVDFVLVHPGTLDVEQVIELEDATGNRSRAEIRDEMTQQILDEAGIKLVRLNRQHAYTAPALATLLGVEPRE